MPTRFSPPTDDLAERVRKIGGRTVRSIGEIAKLQSLTDNNQDFVKPADMIRELMADNKKMMKAMREVHELCDKHDDVATASILENFIDQTERRNWFLFEASRRATGQAISFIPRSTLARGPVRVLPIHALAQRRSRARPRFDMALASCS